MSKYFAKWIPAEGEVTDNQHVFFKINGKWEGPAAFDDFLGAAIEEVKQAKLFLCTRDIKVGDKVQYNDSRATPHIWTQRNEEQDKSLNPYKVIGEVSPDALGYVEEGDIDESLLPFYNAETDPEGWMKEEWGNLIILGTHCNPSRPYVQIKGPCSHFH